VLSQVLGIALQIKERDDKIFGGLGVTESLSLEGFVN
jgi:hypothetical protein